jgi:organic radical activating enzyme
VANHSYNMIDLKDVTEELNTVGKGFCMAKWYHVSMHLHTGQNHSCYHPAPHKIPLDLAKEDAHVLHNSPFKKQVRKEMLEGGRPDECSYCWNVEDLGEDQISDRMLRSSEPWALPLLQETKNIDWQADVYPRYLELNFSNRCQLKCSYCAPMASSSWLQETKKWGNWPLENHINVRQYDNDSFKNEGSIYGEEDTNPYIKIFWDWFPDAYPHLHTLRFTGGEPLLSPNVFKVLDYVGANPKPELEFAVNSNMMIPERNIIRFIQTANDLTLNKKIKGYSLFTSVDTWGKQAEWIRNGLNIETYESNLHYYMENSESKYFSFMVTFCLLAIPNFTEFLDKVLEFRERYNIDDSYQRVNFDTPYTVEPPHLTARIADDWMIDRLEYTCNYLKERVDDTDIRMFSSVEHKKLTRVLDWVKQNRYEGEELAMNRRDFAKFVDEHDRRRGTDFHAAFPELRNFYNMCKES